MGQNTNLPKKVSLSELERNLVFRVLDANLNRAIEGLRVVEEFGRFVASHKKVSTEIKNLRHQLSLLCQKYSDQWAEQRNSGEDVGAEIAAADEYSRSSLEDLVGANLARVNQALRALEEYSKVVSPEISPGVEAVRYQFYDVEKNVKRVAFVERSLANRVVYVLTSGCASTDEFSRRIEKLCQAGADLIQLREKNLSDGEILLRAKLAAKICANYATLFIVNDRPDVALMSGADGVHVGQDEFSVGDIRKIIPANMLIGVSTHSIEQALQAEQDGADYIGVGPTFPSHTKCFTEFTGTELLQKVAAAISVPAFAIGGINLENVEQVAEAGLARVAVSGVIHSADSCEQVIESIRATLTDSRIRK